MIATIEHIVTDQGNGGAYCSNCGQVLNPPLGYNNCPKCYAELHDGGMYINMGGTDF